MVIFCQKRIINAISYITYRVKHVTSTTVKWTKRAILILAIIPILLFLAFAGAVSLIDFNQYKPEIEQEVSKLTQREFKIEGEVKVSILPFMFHLGDIRLKNKAGFDAENFMSMKEAQIELSLRELFLQKTLKVISLELIEPKLHFIKKAQGNNWSDIELFSSVLPRDNLPQKAKLSQSSEVSHFNEFKSNTAESQYTGFQKVSLLKVQAESSEADIVNDVPKVSEDVPLSATQSQPEKVNLGQVTSSWKLESIVVKNAQIDFTDLEQNFTVSLKKANLLSFDVEPNKPFQIISDFVYEHSQTKRLFDFEINAKMLLAKQYSQLHLTNWHGVFRLQLPKELARPDVRLTTQGENLMIDFSNQQIFIKRALLNGLNSEVETSFNGSFGAKPTFEGDFRVKDVNIKSWIEHLGFVLPELAVDTSLTNATGTFQWKWDGETLGLKEIDAKLDQSNITGSVSIPFAFTGMTSQAPMQFDLQVSNLILESYRFKRTQSIGEDSEMTRPGQSDEWVYPIPVAFLESSNLEGQLQLVDFSALQKQAKQVHVAFTNLKGQLALAPLDIELGKGVIKSKFLADLTQSTPMYFWKGQTKSLPLSDLVVSSVSPIDGVLDSHFSLKTQGINAQDLAKNLQGTINANIEQAKVYGLDLNQLLQGEMALVSNQPVFTQFEQIKLIGQFDDGIFTPKRFLAKAERFKGSGIGALDLNAQTVSGDLRLLIDNPSEALAELRDVVIPLTFKGDMMQPHWSVNLAELSPKIIEKSPALSALQAMIENQ